MPLSFFYRPTYVAMWGGEERRVLTRVPYLTRNPPHYLCNYFAQGNQPKHTAFCCNLKIRCFLVSSIFQHHHHHHHTTRAFVAYSSAIFILLSNSNWPNICKKNMFSNIPLMWILGFMSGITTETLLGLYRRPIANV